MHGAKIEKNEDEETLWEVEDILDKTYDPIDRRHKYKIKWKGYSLKEATWEPIENLMSVQVLVDRFENQLKAKKNPPKSKIGTKNDDGFLSPQEIPSRDVKVTTNNNTVNASSLNNSKVGSSLFGTSLQSQNERTFENTIEIKAANEIVIGDEDDKPGHLSLNNSINRSQIQNRISDKVDEREKSVIDLGPFLSAKRSNLVEEVQHSSLRTSNSRFTDSPVPPNQHQTMLNKPFQQGFGQSVPPVQPNSFGTLASLSRNEIREKDRLYEKERERDQAKDLASFGRERGSHHREEDRIHNRNRDRDGDGEASRERSVDNSRLNEKQGVPKGMVKEEVFGGSKPYSGQMEAPTSIKTENRDGSGIMKNDKPLERKRTVLKKTLHAKHPLKKRVNINPKGHYETVVNGYLTKQLDRKTFLELLCPEGNFKEDEIQQIKCISWDGKATMDPDDYYFKVIWKPRADGAQKAARYASWQEILEESPEEAADFIFEKLITIISKYGTFGEF